MIIIYIYLLHELLYDSLDVVSCVHMIQNDLELIKNLTACQQK